MSRYGKIARRLSAAMANESDVLFLMGEAVGTAFEANKRFEAMYAAMKEGNYDEAGAHLARMSGRVRALLPDIVVEFVETASKKKPGSETWKSGVSHAMERLLLMGARGTPVYGPKYLTFREGTSNKFHMFVVFKYSSGSGTTMYVAANGFGRIGAPAKVFELVRTSSQHEAMEAVYDKERAKRAKGYEEE